MSKKCERNSSVALALLESTDSALNGREKEMGSGEVSRMLGSFHVVLGSEFRAERGKILRLWTNEGPARPPPPLLPATARRGYEHHRGREGPTFSIR